jgi:beta-1,4-mannosyl-glycoprotein beta-1,4-N-acetylglucosaminyltransferase
VESPTTFTGKEKELYYENNKDMFAQFASKIIHIVVDDMPYKYPDIDYVKRHQWQNEEYQRNSIAKGIEQLDLEEEDLIMITDVDEIIDPTSLEDVKVNGLKEDILKLEMEFYYYNLGTKQLYNWYYGRILTNKKYKELNLTCEKIRKHKNCKTVRRFGWHLSYFGDSAFIKNKIESFSHQEYNKEEYTNKESVDSHISNSTDLYGNDYNITKKPLSENHYLPIAYEQFLQKYIM